MNFREADEYLINCGKVKRKGWGDEVHLKRVFIGTGDKVESTIKLIMKTHDNFSFDVSKLYHCEWIEVENTGSSGAFNALDAIDMLKEGKKVKNIEWENKFLIYNHIDKEITLCGWQDNDYIPYQDVLAEDWEIVQ